MKVTALRLAAAALVASLSQTVFAADVDGLSVDQTQQIRAAYAQALAVNAPAVDALSSAQLAMIDAAFAAALTVPSPAVDQLAASQWAKMQEAYATHDRAPLELAGRR